MKRRKQLPPRSAGRQGHPRADVKRRGPDDPSEDQVSIDAAYVLRDSFSGSALEAGVRTFFDELIEILTGGAQKH
jgi:hypothetical protein